jgi:hypothetical protein
MSGRHIAILILKLKKQSKEAEKALAPEVLATLYTLRPAEIRIVD